MKFIDYFNKRHVDNNDMTKNVSPHETPTSSKISQQNTRLQRAFVFSLAVALFGCYCYILNFSYPLRNRAIRPRPQILPQHTSALRKALYDIRESQTTVSQRRHNYSNHGSALKKKLVLFWTLIPGTDHTDDTIVRAGFDKCPVSTCEITFDKGLLKESEAVIISLAQFDPRKDPIPKYRRQNQRWVFYGQEPPPIIHWRYKSLRMFNGWFNWTMSYREDSDITHRYGTVVERDKPAEFLARINYAKRKTKYATWWAAHCPTDGRRENVVKELSKYIPVDVFGSKSPCGQMQCPKCNWADMLQNTYRFYLAFENSICKDYVTEKFYRCLKSDIVPVVLGGANYSRIAPPNSFIDVRDFPSVRALGNYLRLLSANDTLYNEYFAWKRDFVVRQTLYSIRDWCVLCEKLHDDVPRRSRSYDLQRWFTEGSACMRLDTDATAGRLRFVNSTLRRPYKTNVRFDDPR